MRFEDRLGRAVALVCGALVACTGATKTSDSAHSGTDLAALCDGAPPPEDHQVSVAFVTVPPGDPCPDPAAAQLEVHGCTFLEWQGITCGFTEVVEDQVLVDDGYGGHFVDVGSTGSYTTGQVSDPVDVCYYEGVFYLPPDHPTCGRPLTHEGRAHVASLRPGRGDWADATAPAPRPDDLDPASRAEVGAFWLRSALLEHASVASFGRFALDLLRLGAPADLVARAHAAALDEVGHARDAFRLAGAFLGREVHPGPLAGPWAAATPDREAFAEAVAREGCVGETLAALDAAARLDGARDPAVRDVLQRVVREESAHAALAWDTLAWLLADDAGGGVRDRVAAALADEREKLARPSPGAEPTAAARACGLVPPGLRDRALRLGFDGVVAPEWARLTA